MLASKVVKGGETRTIVDTGNNFFEIQGNLPEASSSSYIYV